MGQLLSLPMLVAGIALLWAAYHYRIPSGNFGRPPTAAADMPAQSSSAR